MNTPLTPMKNPSLRLPSGRCNKTTSPAWSRCSGGENNPRQRQCFLPLTTRWPGLKTTSSSSSGFVRIPLSLCFHLLCFFLTLTLCFLGKKQSIVDYEKETKLSHRSDWDAFYGYVKDFIEADFSKKQLTDKIRNLNKRFLGNKARCSDEEGPSFTDTEDDIIFKLSVLIWDSTNETGCDSDENVDRQAKVVPCVGENMDQGKVVSVSLLPSLNIFVKFYINNVLNKDAPCVEHEKVSESNMDQAKVW